MNIPARDNPRGYGMDYEHPTAGDGPFTLTVEGEVFTVRARSNRSGSYDYTWVSGPNKGYGYSSSRRVAYPSIQDRADAPSGFEPATVEEHRESIRDFLSGINPETGHLGD